MSISKGTKTKLNAALLVTCAISSFYYAFYLNFFYTAYSSGVTDNYLYNLFVYLDYTGFILGIFLPSLVFVFGYGVQTALVFLKPNKRRFIFSIISYSLIVCMFIGFVLTLLLWRGEDLDLLDLIQFFGIVPLSFIHLLFLLVIVSNFVLAIFLTHVKVKEEEKEIAPKYKDLLKDKYQMASFIIALSLGFLALIYFLNAPYNRTMNLFNGWFEKMFPKGKKQNGFLHISFLAGFMELLRFMFAISIILTIVAVIDPQKKKFKLPSVIMQLVYLVFLITFHTLAVTTQKDLGTSNLTKAIDTIGIVSIVLLSSLVITNLVLYFISNKNKTTCSVDVKIA